jgi:hypothetical protein
MTHGFLRPGKTNATRTYNSATATFPCPGGTSENSPTFQRWVAVAELILVPEGRLKRHFQIKMRQTAANIKRNLLIFLTTFPPSFVSFCEISIRAICVIRGDSPFFHPPSTAFHTPAFSPLCLLTACGFIG